MHFQAVTTWQTDEYDISVSHGSFTTAEEAALIANGQTAAGVRSLCFADGELYLLFNDGGRLALSDADIEVRRLKPVGVSPRRPWSIDDFELTPIGIADFAGMADLMRGFDPLGYCVRDALGRAVPMPALVD